jgi:sec-independent protein translocase protein TatA
MIGLDNPLHIALVVVVVLLLFGAKRLPEMGRSLGEGLRTFKDSMQDHGTEFKGSLEETSAGFKESLHGDDPATGDAPGANVTEASETPSVPPAA